jgi:hypothetical protein
VLIGADHQLINAVASAGLPFLFIYRPSDDPGTARSVPYRLFVPDVPAALRTVSQSDFSEWPEARASARSARTS